MNLAIEQNADMIGRAQRVEGGGEYLFSVTGNHGSWVRLQTRTEEVAPWQIVEGSHTRSDCEKIVTLGKAVAFVRVQILNVKAPSSISVRLTESGEATKTWWGKLLQRYSLASMK